MTELERIIEQIKIGQARHITKIVSYYQIGEEEAIAFANALIKANLPHLEEIDLSFNKIGDVGAIALAKALKEANLPHLDRINLDDNNIGDVGAIALANALKEANLPNLERIDLSSNQIGDDGAKALAETLKGANLPRLEEIDLSFNKIGDEGAIAIANALKEANLPHLDRINLDDNNIGDVGAIALANALKEANLPHLEFIDLEDNQIGDNGAEEFAKALKEANLPHIKSIFLGDNQIGDDGAEALNAASETCISSNEKHLAEAKEKAKQKLQLNWDSTAELIKQALIDIEYANLLQKEGKLKVAIDLFGAALHGFRHLIGKVPKFLDIKQIVKQTTEAMKIAIKDYKAKVGKLKLPVFVLLECFEHLNAKIFEKDLLKLIAKLDIKNIWDPNLAGSILNMLPSRDVSDFSFDAFRKLAATDSKDESDAYNITGDVGAMPQADD